MLQILYTIKIAPVNNPLIDGIRIGLVILVFPEYSIQISLVYEKGRTCLVVLDVVDIKTIDIITH